MAAEINETYFNVTVEKIWREYAQIIYLFIYF